MRVGAELKAARKKAGITVEVISKRTKISVNKLIALEKNDFKNLPTGLYLFAAVRAYAREVHIDAEPIVERLRAEFADKDALDALHALDATGALDAKTLADPGRSKRSNFLRHAAIAAAVVLMAAGAVGAYLHNIGHVAPPPSVSSPAPAAMVASAVDVPQQASDAAHPSEPAKSAPANTYRPKPRAAAVISGVQDTAETDGAVSEAPVDTPASIEGLEAVNTQ